MGAVYLARHGETGARHAVKVILGQRLVGERERSLARFQREVEVLARIEPHPNLVGVHAAGADRGTPWCAMDYVEGRSLGERLASGPPLPPSDAARLVVALCDGLAHAHRKGVLHRDLKPDNVLLDEVGVPRLVDFGLAYDVFADQLTATGECLGTPAYMAPEQVSRRSTSGSDSTSTERGSDGGAAFGPSTDVYGLGAILYACLTGEPPFTARDPLAMIVDIVKHPPRPPRHLAPSIPAPLEAICLKALEKRPADRYAGARELAADLLRFERGEPILARRASPIVRLLRWPTRSGLRLASVLAAIAAVAVAVAWSTLGSGLFETPPRTRLGSLLGSLQRRGRLDDAERRTLAALADHADVIADPALARRAELGRALVAALDTRVGSDAARTAGLEVARIVRPGGELEAGSLDLAVSVLADADRAVALDAVLLGAEPRAPIPRLVTPLLARAALRGTISFPLDDATFETLRRAPGLDATDLGELHLGRSRALVRSLGFDLEEADDLDPAVLLAAIDASVVAFHEHGVAAESDWWPPALRRFAHDELLRRLQNRDPRAEPLADLIVLTGRGEQLVDAELVGALQREARAFTTGFGKPSREVAETMLIAGAFLEAHACWPVHPHKLHGLVEAYGLGRLVERGKREMARPRKQRNPARLVFIALVLRDTPAAAEGDAFIAAAVEVGLSAVWIQGLIGRWHRLHDRDIQAIAWLEGAIERDRARPIERRLPVLPERLADSLITSARKLQPRSVPVWRDATLRSIALLDEAVRIQNAVRPRLEAISQEGAIAPWPLHRGKAIANRYPEVAWMLLELGEPDCCGVEVTPRDGEPARTVSIESVVGEGIEVLGGPIAGFAFTEASDRGVPSEAELLEIRGRHQARHGRYDAATTDLRDAIDSTRRFSLPLQAPARRMQRVRLIAMHRALGDALGELGDETAARAAYDEASSIATELAAEDRRRGSR